MRKYSTLLLPFQCTIVHKRSLPPDSDDWAMREDDALDFTFGDGTRAPRKTSDPLSEMREDRGNLMKQRR
jgi:hypothetical protein